MHIFEEQFHNP